MIGNLIFYLLLLIFLKILELQLKNHGYRINLALVYLLIILFFIPTILAFAVYPGWWLYLFKRPGHLLTGFLTAYIFNQIYSEFFKKQKITLTVFLRIWLLFASVSAVAVVDEILDLYIGVIHGLTDTATDLVVNNLGLLFYLFFLKFFPKLSIKL